MRQNGLGTLSLDEARTWIEETGLCLFLPKRQFSTSVAPSFVEAVAGRGETTPDQKTIALAEDLLIRLENEGVAVRLNLLGQPGEQPDFVVAGWVLPYVYALRGDRDWRRSPQLTGSRQVSQLAVNVYKKLEGGDLQVSQLKQALGREVTESAVIRAITELWQQLRIIPVIAARGQAARWQLLRTRFQRAIAEGASTSQVTAISVLASIYLQAVIAASMEDVELFLAPLTARSKIREVIRGLVATRQVHTISLGHAPHFYVAGTLPEFEPVSTIYASSAMPASSYFTRSFERDDEKPKPAVSVYPQQPAMPQPILSQPAVQPQIVAARPSVMPAPVRPEESVAPEHHAARPPVRRPAKGHERKSARTARPAASSNGHPARRTPENRNARLQNGSHANSSGRWSAQKNGNGKHASGHAANGSHPGKTARVSTSNGARRTSASAWSKRAGTSKAKPAQSRKGPSHKSRPELAAAGRAATNGKRFFNNRSKQGTKKRG